MQKSTMIYKEINKHLLCYINLLLCVFLLNSCDFVQNSGAQETSTQATNTPPSDFTVSQDQNSQPTTPNDNSTLPSPTTSPNPDDISFEEGFTINQGALKTNTATVTLDLKTLTPYYIKVGTAMDCSDGNWQNYQSSLDWNLSHLNSNNIITVRFQDWEGSLSPCYRRSIIHDNQGPEILFAKYPTAIVEENTTAEIIAQVTDNLSPVTTVKCRLNDIIKSCFSGENQIKISNLPQGNYTFTVEASDDLQNVSVKSIQWQVNSLYKNLTQEILVNDYRKIDILFVIDNSGSMEYEQKSMAQRTSQFLSLLRGLDFQIAITTTDPRNISLGDGRLVPIKRDAGGYIIDSNQEISSAQTQLSQTLQRSEVGSGSEQGIRSVYRAIERYKNNESNLRSFFRDHAQFAVVLISDEDESDNTTKNDPQSLINLISSTWQQQKRFSFHSIITKPGDTQCRGTYGYSYGERYKTMSELTGGLIGSVCEMDYSNQVKDIAEGIRSLLKTLTLDCPPSNQKSITVFKDGVALSDPFSVEGVNLRFQNELLPGKYNVNYSCLK